MHHSIAFTVYKTQRLVVYQHKTETVD